MLSELLAVLVFAVTPLSEIRGGTSEQRTNLKSILDRLPDCITAPGGTPIAVKIVSGTGPQAIFGDYDGTLEIDASLLDRASFADNSRALKEDLCVTGTDISWMVDDTRRVIVHELAHALQRRGKSNITTRGQAEPVAARLESFFKIRFDGEIEQWDIDPERQEDERLLDDQLDAAKVLRQEGKRVPATMLGEICSLQQKLQAKYRERGLPSRFRHDRHAAKKAEVDLATGEVQRRGAEFFAIAIESLVGNHGVYCKHFTPDEQRWLATDLGGCLGGLAGKASCYPGSNNGRPAPRGAGTQR